MNEDKVILLLSGGIDSTTLLAELVSAGKQVYALSFDYGQRHAVELDFAQKNAAKYKVLAHCIIKLDLGNIATNNMLSNKKMKVVNYNTLPMPQSICETYVPGRNLLMLSHAAAYAENHGLKDIYFAANADDGKRFPDCRPQFISALNQLWLSCPNTADIKIYAPYMNTSKAEVIKKSIQLSVDLKQTLSCYAPIGNKECGTCMSCVLKQKAMNEL